MPWVVRWLRSLRWAFSPSRRVEAWLHRWRDAASHEPVDDQVCAVAAAIVHQWTPEERERYRLDPRPEIRALWSWVRSWPRKSEPWRERMRKMQETVRTGVGAHEHVERFLRDLREAGVPLRRLTGKDERQWLVGVRLQGRVLSATREATCRIRECTNLRDVKQIRQLWRQRYAKALLKMGDEDEVQQASDELESAYFGTWLGLQWRAAVDDCREGDIAGIADIAMRFKIPEIKPWRDLRDVFEIAWYEMEPHDREEIEQCAAMETQRSGAVRAYKSRRVRADARDALERSSDGRGDPRSLDWLMAKRDSCDWIHRYKFALWERLRTANERVSNRRERVRDIGMSFGITATAPEERARQAAALTPTQAARWIGADVTIVQLDEPQGWEAIQQPLRKFPTVVRRRMSRATRSAPEENQDRAVAGVVDRRELAALRVIEPGLTRELMDTIRRVERQQSEYIQNFEDSAKRIRALRDPQTRRQREAEFAIELLSDRAREALTREKWIRMARHAGLGYLGGWRMADVQRVAVVSHVIP